MPLRNRNNEVVALLGIIRDITEARKAEMALRESRQSYRTLAENLPGIVYRLFLSEGKRIHFLIPKLRP